jgi:hypothetical protein
MNFPRRTLLACLPLLALAACGGDDDVADRLDVADPVVRFVDASAVAPNLTLFKGATAQSDATNVGYQFGSNYFDVDLGSAVWATKTADGVTTLGSATIDPQRGTRYTIVALSTSATAAGTALIVDPYNKPLGSSSTHLRLFNASYPFANVDVYMNAAGTDISAPTITPLIAGVVFDAAGPASGSDSVDIPGGTYQLSVTTSGTKTVLFKGQVSFGNNQDVLLLTVPSTTTPGAMSALVKIEGTAGAGPVTPL